MISLIVAFSRNRAIGKNNKLLWHIPNDLKYFKEVTLGKTIIMGRRTFESIGRPLPNRQNVVLTNNLEWEHQGVEVIHSLDEIQLSSEEVIFIGGETIYEQILPFVERMYITYVDEFFEGDAFFPQINRDNWKQVKKEKGVFNESNPYNYYFLVYEKKKAIRKDSKQ
ncbi:dihydrofolate reductase [Priestia megaterium]|uniref:Dihydrofolate reductase n=1 Tax=Priestia megaterium TaxID=1404 RepID=A0A6M6EAR1_PRIMG|nr:dihydrofolate reductase [Priestia megaterium]QJX80655.1 dihydrofolate reductase [Priestia megaterium]